MEALSNPTELKVHSHPGTGPIRQSNQQRKQDRFKRRANELFCESLRIYLGMKNHWIQEHEIADLCPARINAISDLYFNEFKTECPWFPTERLANDEAQQLGLITCEEVNCLNVNAEEFKVTTLLEDETVERDQSAVDPDSGIATSTPSGVVTPLLEEVAEQLQRISTIPAEPLVPPQASEPHTITFGDFDSNEFMAITSGVTEALVVPNLTLDFLSNVTDCPVQDAVVNVICPVSPEANGKYYGSSTLSDLLQHCESSLMVKSFMIKPKVKIARSILSSVRVRSVQFIARAVRMGLLDGTRTTQLVNSLCDDAYCRTGKKVLNPQTRWKISSWLQHMKGEYYKNRLSKYLPDDLRPTDYHPRASRTLFKQN